MQTSITFGEFQNYMHSCLPEGADLDHIAVGCSGGPDSMALTALLSAWSVAHDGPHIHVLIVNHGLRPEACAEAEQVQNNLSSYPKITSVILDYKGEKPEARIQETARTIRYDLMNAYCRENNITYLCLAHHQDDQAETVLFRLAKGSGLDGLSGMKSVQPLSDSLILIRPVLDTPKAALHGYCTAHNIPYVEDPSNKNKNFARVRLRGAYDVLANEGLTTKRLAVTAKRLARAQDALDHISAKAFESVCTSDKNQVYTLCLKTLNTYPAEISLRVLITAIKRLRPDAPYNPRMEKIEILFEDLIHGETFRTRTLGGLLFTHDEKLEILTISIAP